MHEHGSLPRARRKGLLEETLGDELLLYDQNNDTAHCLSPIAACVWRHCNGERDVTGLALLAGTNEGLVADALRELREQNLLDAKTELVPGESRREAIVRVGRYAAAAAGASMIVSAAAATPAMAASGELVCKEMKDETCCRCLKSCTNGIASKEECEKKICEAKKESFIGWEEDKHCLPA
jgi:hypothetical protein